MLQRFETVHTDEKRKICIPVCEHVNLTTYQGVNNLLCNIHEQAFLKLYLCAYESFVMYHVLINRSLCILKYVWKKTANMIML